MNNLISVTLNIPQWMMTMLTIATLLWSLGTGLQSISALIGLWAEREAEAEAEAEAEDE